MTKALADTNILLRHFLEDVPHQAQAIDSLLSKLVEDGDPPLLVMPSTVSEVVFVALGSIYKLERQAIVAILSELLEGPFDIADQEVVARATTLFGQHHDDWDDCLLAAYALEHSDGTVVSFDRGLDRIPGLTRIEPGATQTNG